MKKLMFMCFILMATNTFAQSVAKVLFSAKKVMASRNGVERPLARGASLEVGDTVITADGALVNIKYSNGTLVNIGERSNYTIVAYSLQSDTQIKAELNAGKIKFKTPGKVKETLKTPVMALAILGTEVSVYVAKADKVYVAVAEGKVRAGSTVFGPGKSFLITPNTIVNAPFPAVGQVNTPKGVEGTIAAASTTQNTSDVTNQPSQDTTTGDNAALNTITTVAQIADAGQVVSTSVATNNAAAAIISPAVDNLAALSILCL